MIVGRGKRVGRSYRFSCWLKPSTHEQLSKLANHWQCTKTEALEKCIHECLTIVEDMCPEGEAV